MIDDTALLEELRPYAFSIAYRMLGSVAEAEDVVQEALLRVHGAVEAGTRFESPRAYVATVTTRLALDQLKSARVRRETYVGEWLPEPIVTDEGADPERHAEVADMVSYAFLALLERLSPEQRAVLLLRDVFEYEYPEIASIVGTSPENARQLASRARRNVTERRPRFEASREDHRALVAGFLAAVDRGDVQALERMLAEDVVLHGDGGGKVPAVMRALQGRDHAIRTLAAWWRAGMAGRAVARVVEVNGEPGAVLRNAAGELLGVIAIEVQRRPDRGDPFRGQPGQAPAPRSGRRHARPAGEGWLIAERRYFGRRDTRCTEADVPPSPASSIRSPSAASSAPSVRASASPKSSGGSSRWSMMRTSSSSVYCTSILSPAPVGPLMPQRSRMSRRSDLSGCRLGIAVASNGTVRGTQGGS